MVTARRYLEKFVNKAETLSVTFPELAYEYEPRSDLITPFARSVGMDGGVDQLGYARSIRGPRMVRVRFVLDGDTVAAFDTAADTLKATAYRISKGKLWTLGADGTRRWSWARLTDAPDVGVMQGQHLYAPVIMGFRCDPDEFAEAAVTRGPFLINSSPQTVVVNNPGNIPALVMVIRMRANAAAGFTNPLLLNLENGYSIGTLRDSASANSEVKLDLERPSMEYSNDDGLTYADDYVNRVLGTGQALWMVLEPGDNDIEVTTAGTPNWNLEFTFFPPFA